MVNKVVPGLVVVVTGAGSGIGRATAAAFAAGGATVVCADIDGEAAEKTAALCAERGGSGRAERCDVTDPAAVAALAERSGAVDVLVNNAGVGMTGRFADMSIDDWRWIRSVNLDGVVHGCAGFGPGMIARRSGQVVNVSSGLAYTTRATEGAYVATKAAVLALSRCLRADWAPYGVGVTAVCPGVIDTPIVGSTRYLGSRGDARTRSRIEKIFRRGHPPEAVARAIVAAAERNPAVVPVGWEARLGWHLQRVTPLAVQD
ncbi:MAG TPA: SDR family NAD(P)-dependent oxidoreductase, partial [Acidimicrobiia bacterium]|nr:SDR family NAD(P)-dependent oxidoreductase [Acidimicrobiia bacterium]